MLLASVAGAALALETYTQERTLSVGTVDLNVDLGHPGALDLYVPLVDWGVRFDAVRLPVRVKLDVRSLDREVLAGAAGGEVPAVQELRVEATEALTGYLRTLIVVVALASLAAGMLVALALRSGHVAPLRRLMLVAAGGAVLCTVVAVVLLPPRGDLDDPEYYANGPDIPVALQTLETLRRSGDVLGDELDAQLLGLARLVQSPGRRRPIEAGPRMVVASDLHNNVLAVPTLERAARDALVLFAGDLTDRGTPLESAATRRIVSAGGRFVAVSGNHDSDTSMRRLAREGAVVLTRHGRYLPRVGYGPRVVTVRGVRIAGYDSPNERRAADDYADRGASVTRGQREAFSAWLRRLLDARTVDVVMVHEPELAADAVAELRREPRVRPPVVVTGHTHRQRVVNERGVLEVNGGTLGAGGTGNLAEPEADALGLAVLRYEIDPFRVLAVDTVRIDPQSGSASAQRLRLR
ncbi:MAG: metallophosphoesterase [Solirubrobacteraceae bacterium]|nr:metallophosphoesterase [Solirubrobacteraceae bacterium]